MRQLLTLPAEGGDWTRNVYDVRDILKLYEIETTDEFRCIMFMSFCKEGTFVTIVHMISGRGGDNVAAWLYISNEIEISGEEICQLIEVVKKQLSQESLDEHVLQKAFATTYPVIPATENPTYNETDKIYAMRKTDYFPLKRLIGTERYQPYYKDYAAILLITEDSFPIATGSSVVDLTQKGLEETVVFCPPKSLPQDVVLYVTDNGKQQFTSPIRVKKGQILDFQLAKKNGPIPFVPISFKYNAEENGQECCLPQMLPWKGEVKYETFTILSEDNIVIKDAVITLNGQTLNRYSNVVQVPEDEFSKSKVSVEAKGYEPKKEQNVDFYNKSTLRIKLNRITKMEEYDVTLRNGAPGKVKISSKNLDKTDPLKGYVVKDGELVYSNSGVWLQRLYGFLAAVVVFLIVVICIAIQSWYENHTFEWKLGIPPLEIKSKTSQPTKQSQIVYIGNSASNNTSEASSLDKAISYLDANEAWEREKLNQYPDLKGLFEELNTYDFDKLKNRGKKLQKSSQYQELIKAIDRNKTKKFQGKYNGEGDNVITVSSYIDRLNKDTKPSANAGTSKGTSTKSDKEQNKSNPRDLN